ncbi:MAG: hypothetical protein QF755_04275 [Candidatus Peribacteraceae bacterium]|nr:hypothetical protein [Candidatus Peribacteraceae bacterium]
MEHTQFNFSPSESRLCDFFGKRARARRQERRSRRRGGQEQAQQNVSATEYVDQEEDKEVTPESLKEKRSKIQERMDAASKKFKKLEEQLKARGQDKAAEELSKYYQEEYLKNTKGPESVLAKEFVPLSEEHSKIKQNPKYQKQVTRQCGRCQYYRWILVRRQSELDELERGMDKVLDKYADMVGKLEGYMDNIGNKEQVLERSKKGIKELADKYDKLGIIDIGDDALEIMLWKSKKSPEEVVAKMKEDLSAVTDLHKALVGAGGKDSPEAKRAESLMYHLKDITTRIENNEAVNEIRKKVVMFAQLKPEEMYDYLKGKYGIDGIEGAYKRALENIEKRASKEGVSSLNKELMEVAKSITDTEPAIQGMARVERTCNNLKTFLEGTTPEEQFKILSEKVGREGVKDALNAKVQEIADSEKLLEDLGVSKDHDLYKRLEESKAMIAKV